MKLLLLDRPVDKGVLKDREVEFFGPWAQPIELPEDLKQPNFEPYPTPESVYEASIEAISVALGLLEQLSHLMPALTRVNRGDRFWRLLLGHHVIALAGIVQDIMIRHQALPEKDYVLGLAHDSDCVKEHIPYSWDDGQELIFYNDCFRWYAVGLYLKNCYRNHELIRYLNVPPRRIATRTEELLAIISQEGFKWLLKRVASTFLRRGRPGSKAEEKSDNACSLIWDRYQFGDFDFKKLGAVVLTQEFLPSIKSLPLFPVDEERRAKIKNSLPQPYGELLSLSLPIIAIEGLPYLVDLIENGKSQRFQSIERVYTHGQGFADEGPRRALLALLADEGKRIVSIQHGGGATYFANSGMFLDRVVADEYLCWGPGYSNYGELSKANQTKTLPSIYLSTLRQKSLTDKKRKWETLFVVSEDHYHIVWLYSPLFPDRAHDYFARQKVLFDFFCVRKQVAVKVSPHTFGWGQADWIRIKYPQAKLLASGNFVDYALQSGIVIVDYNSSAFLEMLAVGRPFLATWNRRWSKGNSLFEEFIDKLIEVGVFYEQPGALIRSYTELISPDIDRWWNESKRQHVLKEMADNFALTSDKDYKEWREEFQRSQLHSEQATP